MMKFYFIGVGGTAMGSVAIALKNQGHEVSGSDEALYEPMLSQLQNSGIELFEGFGAAQVPSDVDVVVIGNAMSRGHCEVEAVMSRKQFYLSLPETMRHYLLQGKSNLVITGTHGKTTTTSLTTWLFQYASQVSDYPQPNYMIGGVAKNMQYTARFNPQAQYTILEGDEYDTAFFDKRSKFLHYLPEAVVLGNIEFDHADIYDDLEQILKTFRYLLRAVPQDGLVLANGDDANVLNVLADSYSPVKKVGLGASNDAVISGIEPCELTNEAGVTIRGTQFSFEGDVYQMSLQGEFNVRNAAMAISLAKHAGIDTATIQAGLAQFAGIARRQELKGEVNGVKVIDDFAHHPTALKQAIVSLKSGIAGEGRLVAIFEPRSNTTRRNIFQQDLVDALKDADVLYMLDIKDSRITQEEQLDTQQLIDDVAKAGCEAYLGATVDSMVVDICAQAQSGDVLAVFSNGGFDGIHNKLLEKLV